MSVGAENWVQNVVEIKLCVHCNSYPSQTKQSEDVWWWRGREGTEPGGRGRDLEK